MILDMHVHTEYSYDGIMSAKEIIKVAIKRGLNGIAVVDHHTIRGGLAVNEYKRDMKLEDFISIVGSEIKTEYGEVMLLFQNEEIKTRKFHEVIDEAKDQDCIVVLPHPYRIYGKIDIYFTSNDLIGYFDVVEGFNSRNKMKENILAVELAKMYGKPITGGSDAHSKFEIGKAYTIFKYYGDEEDIRKQILKGSTKVDGRCRTFFERILTAVQREIKNGTPHNLIKLGFRLIKEEVAK